jgi:hypothetical protein
MEDLMNTRLLIITALATFNLAACTIQNWEGGTQEPGTEGGPCADTTDCDPGLICEGLVCADPDAEAICDGGHGAADGTGGGLADGGNDPGQGGADAEPNCIGDADCAAGELCTPEGLCAIPTCADIDDEASCLDRSDCEAVYAGVDCSCGQGCECQAGEAGCVCESFEFFRCEPL